MMRLRLRTVVMKLLAIALALLAGNAHALQIRCAKLFDANSGKLLADQLVTIRGERIVSVSNAGTDPADTLFVPGTCLPGLIDLHTHLTLDPSGQSYTEAYRLNPADIAYRAEFNGRKTLFAGFTTVRDLGDGWGVTVSLRNAVSAGSVVGPRIFTSGKSIATTGGHADPSNGTAARFMGDPGPDAGVINSPEEARKAVRQRYKEGADLIKITATGGVLSVAKNGLNPQFTDAEVEAVVAAARDYGFTVAAHAHGREGMLRAVRAGVTSIEHGSYMDEEIMKLMKSRGTWHVPTLTAAWWVTEKAKEPGFYVPMVASKAAAIGPQIAKTLALAYQFGVPIAFGTDSGVYPHGMNAKEFELLHQAGVPMADALRMATVMAAKVLNQSAEIGALEAGKYADLIVVDGDPLSDPTALQRIKLVVKGGAVVFQPAQP